MADLVDVAFGHWLAGFIDGEGNFDIHRSLRKGRWYFYCRFDMGLRADDRAVLEECQRRLGGKIYAGRAYGPGGNPKVRWEMTSRAECATLAKVLTLYPLRSKKARDFEVWKEALRVSATMVRHHRPDEMLPLWTALRAGRAFA